MSMIDKLFEKASVVDLTICVWPGMKRIEPAELGIKVQDLPKGWALGHKPLVDPDALKPLREIRRATRGLLDDRSRNFQGRHVVKADQVPSLLERFEEARDEFRRETEALVDAYPGLRAEGIMSFQRFFEALAADNPRVKVEVIMENIRQIYPSADTVASRCEMRWFLSAITAPRDGNMTRQVRKAIASEVSRFIEDTTRSISSEITRLAEQARDAIARNRRGAIPDRTRLSILNAIENLKSLNLFDDRRFAEVIEQARQAVASAGHANAEKAVSSLNRLAAKAEGHVEKAIADAAALVGGRRSREIAV